METKPTRRIKGPAPARLTSVPGEAQPRRARLEPKCPSFLMIMVCTECGALSIAHLFQNSLSAFVLDVCCVCAVVPWLENTNSFAVVKEKGL
jgi:hypothetical protein